jgi:hypothetical protein
MKYINQQDERVQENKNIFKIGNTSTVSNLMIKVIQEKNKLEHPINWSIENTMKIANEIKWIELKNGKKLLKLEFTKPK